MGVSDVGGSGRSRRTPSSDGKMNYDQLLLPFQNKKRHRNNNNNEMTEITVLLLLLLPLFSPSVLSLDCTFWGDFCLNFFLFSLIF